MKKRTGKAVALLLAAVCLVSGCASRQTTGENALSESGESKKGTPEQEAEAAMGRYIEQNMDISGLVPEEGERAISLLENGQGEKIIFTYAAEKKKHYSYKMQADGTFNREEAVWLNESIGKKGLVMEIEPSENGSLYAWYFDDDYQPCIVKTADGIASEEVNIPDLKDADVNGFKVTKSGDILISYFNKGCVLYDGASGSEKMKFIQGELPVDNVNNNMDLKGSRLVTVNPDLNGFLVYDLETGKQIQELNFEVGIEDMGIIKIGNHNDYFFMNMKGLHHIAEGGNIVETLIDGSLNSMGMPGIMMNSLMIGEDVYYVLCSDDGIPQLLYYSYDPDVESVPGTELTLFALKESKTVARAISKFQKDNPNVRIVFTTAEGAGGSITDEDSIRTLNTEILGGKGADVLLLDGLPVDSYIEKGVLADISDILAPMTASGELLMNMTQGYEADGRIYGVPARFGIPICYGEEKVVNALKSMDTLQSYLKENQGKTVLGLSNFRTYSYQELASLILSINYKEFFGGGKEVSRPELIKFLNTVKMLSDTVSATSEVMPVPPATEADIKGWLSYQEDRSSFEVGEYPFQETAALNEIKGIGDMMVPLAIRKDYDKVITPVNDIYVPYYIMGLNQASQKQEIAKKFISSVLSEEEQFKDLNDGFPVNANALAKWCGKKGEYSLGIGIGEEFSISADYPSKEQIEEFVELAKSLKVPLNIQNTVRKIILEESEAFFEGSVSVEKAADAVLNKVNRFLTE